MKKIIIVIILLLTILIASLPLLHPQLFRTHDYIHGVRIAEMTQAIRDGHFPVRWTKNFGYGYGMPLFEFYAPLPYYVGSFCYWFTKNIIFSSKMLWLIPNFITAIGGYLLGKKIYGRKGGVIVAVAFTLAPYRAVNLYVRGAIGEAWGMMFFPWIFLGILQFFEAKKNRWQLLLLSLSGLVLSHNLMAMLFFPTAFLFSFVLLLTQKYQYKQKILSGIQLLGIFVASVGFTTFYWLPALVEKGYTQVESRILSGYFHYSQHFLYIRQFFKENWGYTGSVWGPDDGVSFFLGYGQLILLLMFTVLFGITTVKILINKKAASISNFKFLSSLKTTKSKMKSVQLTGKSQMFATLLFSLFMLLVSLFFTLEKSQFIWDQIPFLQTLQFPWRFLSLAIFFLAIIVGAFPLFTRNKIFQFISIVSLILILMKGQYYFQPEKYLQSPNPYYYDDPKRVHEQMSDILPDYIPLGLAENITPTNQIVWADNNVAQDFSIEVNRTHETLLKTHFTQPTLIQFSRAMYPGWVTYIDGEKVANSVSNLGNLQVFVPAGEHLVGVQFQGTAVRNFADLLSLFSLFIIAFFLLKDRKLS